MSESDVLKIAHESDLIQPVPSVEDLPDELPERHRKDIHLEISKRQQIINGLKMEIRQLEKLLEQNV